MINNNQWLALSSQPNTELAELTPNNRGLAYGDGFFTTMAVVNGQILWLNYHRQRLISHAQALQLNIDSDKLLIQLQTHAQQLQQGMIKLIITRAEQSVRGYGFSAERFGSACEIWLKASAMTFNVETLILPNNQTVCIQPATKALCLTSQLACLPPPLAGLKSLNRLDNVLASGELQRINAKQVNSANNKSYGEGLLRDMTGEWVEGTMSNVFYQLNETQTNNIDKNFNQTKTSDYLTDLTKAQWYTPSLDKSGVAGVMRHVIIDALATTDKPVIVRSLSDEDLPKLSQLFFCNALRGIMPVSVLTLLNGVVIEMS